LATGTAKSPAQVGTFLKKFSEKGWIESSLTNPPRYFLKEALLGELSLLGLSPEVKLDIHRRLFKFFESQIHWPFRETWLAYHAAHGGLSIQAFCWSILAGESYEERGQIDAAQAYFGYALEWAQNDFKRAYLKGILGETYLNQKKIPLAWSSLKEANTLAENTLPEFQISFVWDNYSLTWEDFDKRKPTIYSP
jgi:tetratricopeptide (TPR) repeat protein